MSVDNIGGPQRRVRTMHPFRRLIELAGRVKRALAVREAARTLEELAAAAGEYDDALHELSLYRSRGHGFGLRFVHVSHGNGGKKCNNGRAGVPHQNRRECGRRQAQHRRGIIDFHPLPRSA